MGGYGSRPYDYIENIVGDDDHSLCITTASQSKALGLYLIVPKIINIRRKYE